jgi:hypothetical protein
MKIISFIDDSEIIKKILNHLGLWDVKRKPPPRANGPPIEASSICEDPSAPGVDDPSSLYVLRRTDPPLPILLRRDKFRVRLFYFAGTSYLIDPDYPVDLSRRSSKNEDGNLPVKKIQLQPKR